MGIALKSLFFASVLTVGVSGLAIAQSASTLGSGGASGGSTTGASGGSAASGGTSASTLGAGATSTSPSSTSSSLATGGSAAGGTKDRSSTKLHGNANNNLHGMSKARAQDKGTWSDSKTKTKIHKGEVDTRTKSMAHEPGGPPVKSTTGISSGGQ
jgi:hypothetical protein